PDRCPRPVVPFHCRVDGVVVAFAEIDRSGRHGLADQLPEFLADPQAGHLLRSAHTPMVDAGSLSRWVFGLSVDDPWSPANRMAAGSPAMKPQRAARGPRRTRLPSAA